MLYMLDLFSGIGGFALAAEIANAMAYAECSGDAGRQRSWAEQGHNWATNTQQCRFASIAHAEVEPFACAVYHKHFPDSVCFGGVQNVTRDAVLERCGVLPVVVTGGFPCQPHSCAGKRLASADDRDLWGECRRILGDLRPRYALFENVAGLLTSESGRFFNRVLSDLAALRYACVWQVVPASAVGAPHRRERVWIICRDESLAHPDKCGGQQDWKPAELRATRTQQPSVNRGRSDAGKDAEEQVWPALAGHWPSRPGEAQHGWEPPRVVGDPKQGGGRGVRPTGQQRQAGLTTRLESRRFAEWQTQPPLGTDADGLPAAVGGAWPEVHNRVAQLKGAGNAIVPQVAALLLKAILDAEHSTPKEP